MKAVIYARYSSENQREESIEGQLRECTAYCQKNDITIVRSYIDRALSAKTDNRPDFQRMIKDSAKGLFDVVLVWKLDRFARNRYDSAHYKAQLKKFGVRVLSATENISEGAEGIILESLLEGMAEYYSAELSEKMIRGHTENALKCKYNGGTPTFGYTIDGERHHQIDPRTAPAVLEMFTRYDNGSTMREIRDYLSDTGVTTVRGKAIDRNFVAAILRCVNTKKYKICTAKHKSVKKTPLESAVVNSVMAKVMDDCFVEYITDAVMDLQGRESSALPALRKQLEDAERGITNMLNAIQAGIINTSTKQRLDELEESKQKIELQINQEEMKHPLLSREDVTYWICRFRTLDVTQLEERRRLIDSFVNSVAIFDDYILITFNCKAGSERVTFDEIKSSDLKSVGGP